MWYVGWFAAQASTVCPPPGTCTHTTLSAALSAAQPDETIDIQHPGPWPIGTAALPQGLTISGSVANVVIQATGGTMFNFNGSVTFDHVILDCHGGTVGVMNGNDVDLFWSEVRNCSGSQGGAFRTDGGTLNVENSYLHDLTASSQGGLIWGNYGDLRLRHSLLCDIEASSDKGGVAYFGGSTSSSLDSANTIWFGNEGGNDGGLVWIESETQSVLIQNDTVVANETSGNTLFEATGATGGLYESVFLDNLNNDSCPLDMSVLFGEADNQYFDTDGDGEGIACWGLGSSNTDPGPAPTDCSDPLQFDFAGIAGDQGVFFDPSFTPHAWQDVDGDGVAAIFDCDDDDTHVNPGESEVCDGLDNDCNGLVDDGAPLLAWYLDGDHDGYGAGSATTSCLPPSPNHVLVHGDCNDGNILVFPGAHIVIGDGIDNDCSGDPDECYQDGDGDGYGASVVIHGSSGCTDDGESILSTDCDDLVLAVNPGEHEVTCDGLDNDCNPLTLDEIDGDHDGFTACGEDCDDTRADINPHATPIVGDGHDNDCTGGVDECYRDVDDDDFGTLVVIDSADATCDGFNEAPVSGDCDDAFAGVNPDATEQTCNGRDDDCDALTLDEPDGDGDSASVCVDCDDADPHRFPGNPEICDGIDNDCVGGLGASEIDFDDDGVRVCEGDCLDNDADVYLGNTEDTCDGKDNDCSTNGVPDTTEVDDDGDGLAECQDDCDDTNGAVSPNATESCNGIDDDCNGHVDDGLTFLDYYPDTDVDGYGDPLGGPNSACTPPLGQVLDHTDCDDSDATTNPGATEQCDAIDHDCDGDPGNAGDSNFWPDLDGDGYGDPTGTVVVACSQPAGYAANDGDCDDGDHLVRPGAPEQCDTIDWNCDGHPTDGLVFNHYFPDSDADGFGDPTATPVSACAPPADLVLDATDCDDAAVTTYPDAPELCDGIDNDCDTVADNGLLFQNYREDLDGDGFGAGQPFSACSQYQDWVVSQVDCDDTNAAIRPDAIESCDGIDNDCDGQTDEGLAQLEWYTDLDDDGYGVGAVQTGCALPASDVATTAGDCDDTNRFISPGAAEQCDGIDNDCDTLVDNGVTFRDWFEDLDDDGFGAGTATNDCQAPSAQHVDNDLDCNDANAAIRPTATEICDTLDNDCDGDIDDDDVDVDAPVWYLDADDDTYGGGVSTLACVAPPHFVDRGGDCDDQEPAVRPNALEICPDGLDNDCDGLVDADDPDYVDTPVTFWADTDGDGVGTPVGGATVCPGPGIPDYFVLPGATADCDDNDPNIFPGATEVCDGLDNDCDGTADDGFVFDDYWPDLDGDGFGDDTQPPASFCDPLEAAALGLIPYSGDCDDGAITIYPGALEICDDGIDQDCDGSDNSPFAQWPDNDGDGYGDAAASPSSACQPLADHVDENTDCDDTNAAVNPAAAEICNDGIDDDCDPGTVEEPSVWYRDTDLDGVGIEEETTTACEQPDDTWAPVAGDCAPDDATRTDCSNPLQHTGCKCSSGGWRFGLAALLRR